ncbi:trypsin beta-like [Schistocerca cancellata]|uniref:trypsin beta-like n=1 Tax=Schistocerca cancellata TaxID=274614 RepID=UPI0021185F56|nr:trypsin beta-like [Schistocerca cancellata]
MVRALVALLYLQACALAAPRAGTPWPRRVRGRIINGTDASVADFPWMLSMEAAGQQWCGASVVGGSWALTAAHCVSAPYLTLRAGSSTWGSGGFVLDVSQTIIHEDFDYYAMTYDFAVLQVSEPFPLGPNVQPVGLPPDGYEPPAGLPVTATGWGATEDVWYPDVLQRVDVEVLDRSVCQEHLGSIHTVTASMLCAGQEGHGACHGDSGSPLVHNGTQLGTVSWGQPTCVGPAAVYGNVASVSSWITNTTGA